jgi:hypothetical protein
MRESNVNSRISLVVLVALAASGCGVPDADGPGDTFGVDFSLPEGAVAADGERPAGAIVFFLDGLNAEIFHEMLEAGELPAFREFFQRRGLYCRRATSNIPSVTMANLPSFVTARMPGHHGVTGVNWFDRDRLIWRDYGTIAQKNTLDCDYTAETIWERLDGETTFSLFFQPHRGVTKFFENWTSAGPPYFFGWYGLVDRLSLYRFGEAMEIARTRGEMPALSVAYMIWPDFAAYEHGVSSEEYRKALRHSDRQIGRVLGDLRRAGLLDRMVIAAVSDHGMVDVRRHWPLAKNLRRMGLDVSDKRLWEQTRFEDRLAAYRRSSVVVYGSGDRYGAICCRKPLYDEAGGLRGWAAWTRRPSMADLRDYPLREDGGRIDLPARLVAEDAVDAVAFRAGPSRVRLMRRGGEVEFAQPDGPGSPIAYRVVRGEDPLDWHGTLPADLRDGEPAEVRKWYAATAEGPWPDLPEQILAYFRARRAGDVAVFAAEGWDLGETLRGGHGGLRPGEMHTPFLLAGPGVPVGTLDRARQIDVAPTLLRLLGRKPQAGADGRDLLAGRRESVEALSR